MKRSILSLCAVAAALTLVATAAFASPLYLGAGVSFAGVNYDKGAINAAPASLLGADAYVGYELNQAVSIELGYTGFWATDHAISALGAKQAVKADIQGGTADLVFAVPFGSKLKILAEAGLTYLNGDVSQGTVHTGGNAWGWRTGLGAQLAVTDRLSLRARGFYYQPNFTGSSGALVAEVGPVLRL